MADKTISLKQLRELQEDGAEVEFDPKSVSVEQFSDLIDAIKQMAANEAERIRADLARNQTNLEILASLQGLIRKAEGSRPQSIDLAPLVSMLEEIRAERETRQPVDYDFNIVRHGGEGFQPAVRIEARAVKPTTH